MVVSRLSHCIRLVGFSGKDSRMDLETLKQDVWKKLPVLTLEELTAITTGLSLTVAESKGDKKSAVYSAIARHLMSDTVEETQDEGEQVFQPEKGVGSDGRGFR